MGNQGAIQGAAAPATTQPRSWIEALVKERIIGTKRVAWAKGHSGVSSRERGSGQDGEKDSMGRGENAPA